MISAHILYQIYMMLIIPTLVSGDKTRRGRSETAASGVSPLLQLPDRVHPPRSVSPAGDSRRSPILARRLVAGRAEMPRVWSGNLSREADAAWPKIDKWAELSRHWPLTVATHRSSCRPRSFLFCWTVLDGVPPPLLLRLSLGLGLVRLFSFFASSLCLRPSACPPVPH